MNREVLPIVIGTGCGSFLSVIVVHVVIGYWDWDQEGIWTTVVTALIGGAVGMVIGFAVLGARANGPAPLLLQTFSWGLLGGVAALLLLCLPCFLLFWISGDRSIFLLPYLFGLPVFAFGMVVGVVVALVKWSRKRKLAPSREDHRIAKK